MRLNRKRVMGRVKSVLLTLAVGAACFVVSDVVRCFTESPLLYAAGNKETGKALTLIRLGSDVNACDDRGRTVLMWAAASKQRAVVQACLDHGADVSRRDHHGSTVLTWAKHTDDRALLALLQKAGARY